MSAFPSLTRGVWKSPNLRCAMTDPPRWLMPWVSEPNTPRPSLSPSSENNFEAKSMPCPPTPDKIIWTLIAVWVASFVYRLRSSYRLSAISIGPSLIETPRTMRDAGPVPVAVRGGPRHPNRVPQPLPGRQSLPLRKRVCKLHSQRTVSGLSR